MELSQGIGTDTERFGSASIPGALEPVVGALDFCLGLKVHGQWGQELGALVVGEAN